MTQPPGRRTVTPRIFTADVEGLADFVKLVFGAEGKIHADHPTELTIGDSTVMISDGREPLAGFLYVYVEDADRTYRRAIAAGADSVEAPADMPWGDRRATVTDSWGNTWQIATYRGGH
jgi:uncharacterized glyoxalase superfamily protein PhnB